MEIKPIFTDDSDYLEHYGVMGMKWGVRNAETLRKYSGSSGKKKKTTKKYSGSEARKARRTVKKERANLVKNRSLLSDSELKSLNDRLSSERRLKEAYQAQHSPVKTEGKRIVAQASKTVLKGAATGVAVYGASKAIEIAMDKGNLSGSLGGMMLKGVQNTLKKK